MELKELRKVAEEIVSTDSEYGYSPENIRAYQKMHGMLAGSVLLELLDKADRLEQAEQDRDKLRNRLDAMRRQRDGYQNQLRKTEQQVQRVRVELGYIPEDFSARIYKALDGDTRRCAECNGTGDVQVRFAHGVQVQDCAVCFGTGDNRG